MKYSRRHSKRKMHSKRRMHRGGAALSPAEYPASVEGAGPKLPVALGMDDQEASKDWSKVAHEEGGYGVGQVGGRKRRSMRKHKRRGGKSCKRSMKRGGGNSMFYYGGRKRRTMRKHSMKRRGGKSSCGRRM